MGLTGISKSVLYYNDLHKDNFFESFVILDRNVTENNALFREPVEKESEDEKQEMAKRLKYYKILSNHFLNHIERKWFNLMLSHNRPEQIIIKDIKSNSKYAAIKKMRFVSEFLGILYNYFALNNYKKNYAKICDKLPAKIVETINIWTRNRSYKETSLLEKCSISTISLRLKYVIKELCNDEDEDIKKVGGFLRQLKKFVHH